MVINYNLFSFLFHLCPCRIEKGLLWHFIGVLLGILEPTLFKLKKCHFPHPLSDLAVKQKLCYNYLERKQKVSSNAFRIHKFLFLSYSSGIETITTSIHSLSSLENHLPIPDQNVKKPYPLGWHISIIMAYIRENPWAVCLIDWFSWGLFTWRCGTPDRWGNMWRVTLPIM